MSTARHIRKTDFERLQKFYNFFVANDEATARAINAKGEQTLFLLPIESTALTKYGEKELAWRDSLGEMDCMIGAHFDTTSLRYRAACQLLREILSHDGHARIVLTLTDKDLQTAYDHDRRRGRLGQDEPEPAEADGEAGAAVTNAPAWGTWGGSIPGAVAGADHL
ncbi:hypothetical protein PR001_g13782 [Phytophthora rubi]|uniref:Uncharacterized protein n=1 Tax=Phytophthora rubi TaxID=129364 RepID=A0A6A3LK08_9STRA|nr:hypothetical protein PR001_g13782 [Phytophthora rubi]